ncbi:MAG TPA: hypothetical protein VM031_02420 [Phycisphaerae bacterium]|nr:hypothetical protein [Phycisphaerae bacterium]
MGGGDPGSGSRSTRGNVKEPTGLPLSAAQKANLRSIGRLISEAQKDARGGKIDPALLRSLGMTRDDFIAFVKKYSQRIGEIEKMSEKTVGPDGTIQGSFILPGSDRRQTGRGLSGKLENVQGSERLSKDEVRKLYEQRASKVSPEYRKQVEAYFRAISEAAGKK